MFSNEDIHILTKILEETKINQKETWAIYGTGNGAGIIYKILCELSVNSAIKSILDRDETVFPKKEFYGIQIQTLTEVCDSLDGIIIAAVDNHAIIRERIQKNLTEAQLKRIRIMDIFGYKEKILQFQKAMEYVNYIEKSVLKESAEFVQFDEKGYHLKHGNTKIIAWYLPQFHQMEINNKFHGQGFTEWTNTSRAIPLFPGHYQPHIPYDVGYYDLLNPSTFERQIFLAKHYGIYGFCFHYYWFSGKRIMEKPLELFLEHKELDMPFCLDWATENWTMLWDGGDKEIMMEQKLRDGDGEKFMSDILPFMKDPRYIRIDNKPVLVIYRVNMFPKSRIIQLLSDFRKIAKESGFPDLYIILTDAFGFNESVAEWGADALVEFPPLAMGQFMEAYKLSGYRNPYFNGEIFDALSFVEKKEYMISHGQQTYFRSALTSWDSTARKAISGGWVLQGLTPQTFKEWLSDILIESRQIHSPSEDIVFVNSWNEWGEGSHLEPDMRYGYAYLQSVKEALEEQR
nr:glycoside hydrolase family 99-like domain-containing protein [uncultured Schaedlerella sp.]